MKESKFVDYSQITESPGLKATQEQIERLYQRYHFAKKYAVNNNVLEVACGSGIGLGYLAEVARRVVGGDIDKKNLDVANNNSRNQANKIDIGMIDAHNLPFSQEKFGLVLLYEAIYYLKNPQQFIAETVRILQKSGTLIICTVNIDWEDFLPSPYTHKYFSVPELYGLLKDAFKDVTMYGAFPVEKQGVKTTLIHFIKKLAVNLNLIPGSLDARAYLKRIFIGKLAPLPERIYENMAPLESPIKIDENKVCKDFKIIYAVARK